MYHTRLRTGPTSWLTCGKNPLAWNRSENADLSRFVIVYFEYNSEAPYPLVVAIVHNWRRQNFKSTTFLSTLFFLSLVIVPFFLLTKIAEYLDKNVKVIIYRWSSTLSSRHKSSLTYCSTTSQQTRSSLYAYERVGQRILIGTWGESRWNSSCSVASFAKVSPFFPNHTNERVRGSADSKWLVRLTTTFATL